MDFVKMIIVFELACSQLSPVIVFKDKLVSINVSIIIQCKGYIH